jgi:hypothetical protein
MVQVGCWAIACLAYSTPSLPGLPTSVGAAMCLHCVSQAAQALGACWPEAAGLGSVLEHAGAAALLHAAAATVVASTVLLRQDWDPCQV